MGSVGTRGWAEVGGLAIGTPRIGWMDSLRGLSVSLVVMFHASGQFAGDGSVSDVLTIANDLFAPLRMPTMVFLSGLLVPRSLTKGTREFRIPALPA